MLRDHPSLERSRLKPVKIRLGAEVLIPFPVSTSFLQNYKTKKALKEAVSQSRFRYPSHSYDTKGWAYKHYRPGKSQSRFRYLSHFYMA